MKILLKKGLLSGLMLLFAGNVLALPIQGDTIKMNYGSDYEHFGMTITQSLNDSTEGDFFNSFCVERNEYLNQNGLYNVDSVTNYAENGGKGYDDGGQSTATKDYISDVSIWLYASYFDGLFGERSYALGSDIQDAIWFEEDEFSDNNASMFDNWKSFVDLANNDFSISGSGWDIQVVNLSRDGVYAQSQLAGAQVPEPSTLALFGIGLLGLTGFGRRKIK